MSSGYTRFEIAYGQVAHEAYDRIARPGKPRRWSDLSKLEREAFCESARQVQATMAAEFSV